MSTKMDKTEFEKLKKEAAGKISGLFDYLSDNNLEIESSRYGHIDITYKGEITVRVVDRESKDRVSIPPFCEASLVLVK